MLDDKLKELQVMRWAITHRPQDLPRSKHIPAKGKTLEEEVTTLSIDDFIGVYAKPESCEGTIVVCLTCRIYGFIRTLVRRQEKFCNACEDDRVLECEIR